jgi:hypothetical protein
MHSLESFNMLQTELDEDDVISESVEHSDSHFGFFFSDFLHSFLGGLQIKLLLGHFICSLHLYFREHL